MQIVAMAVPAQEGITRDNVSVRVDAVVYFRVVDPIKATINVQNYMFAISQQAQTSLRSIIGQSEMDQLLAERATSTRSSAGSSTSRPRGPGASGSSGWRSRMCALPEGMKRSMSRQAEAERERRARIITADGEYQASKRLAAAANVMARDPAALQLRLLQTVVEVAGGAQQHAGHAGPGRAAEVLRQVHPRYARQRNRLRNRRRWPTSATRRWPRRKPEESAARPRRRWRYPMSRRSPRSPPIPASVRAIGEAAAADAGPAYVRGPMPGRRTPAAMPGRRIRPPMMRGVRLAGQPADAAPAYTRPADERPADAVPADDGPGMTRVMPSAGDGASADDPADDPPAVTETLPRSAPIRAAAEMPAPVRPGQPRARPAAQRRTASGTRRPAGAQRRTASSRRKPAASRNRTRTRARPEPGA